MRVQLVKPAAEQVLIKQTILYLMLCLLLIAFSDWSLKRITVTEDCSCAAPSKRVAVSTITFTGISKRSGALECIRRH